MTEEQIINLNIGLIRKIANQYFYGIEREDLHQAGIVGILNAYRSYRTNGNTKFSTYAFSFIFGEMYKLATQKQIKVSRDLLRLYKLIEKTRYQLAQVKGRIVSNKELANYLEKEEREINQAIEAGSIVVASLDQGSSDDRSLYETIADEEKVSLDERITLQDGLDTLNEDEREIIKYRYFEDLTQSEVARKLKMTQVKVSRYEKKGIDKMREYYVEN